MSLYAADLDTPSAIQHVPKWNALALANSAGVAFAMKQRYCVGLNFRVYGGTIVTPAGVPTKIADQAIVLTPSATNYVWHDTDGVVAHSTFAPVGWPGPMSTGASAMYELDVGADSVNEDTSLCYLVGKAQKGPKGAIGATGLGGNELYQQRKRFLIADGNSSTAVDGFGLTTQFGSSGAFAARGLGWAGSGNYSELVGYVAITGSYYGVQNLWHRGAAAGQGGFDIAMRWAMDTTFQHSGQRTFYGLFDNSGGAIGNTEPSSLTNIIGVGNDAADSNLSIMHNDGSGTATKVALGASFPAFNTFNIYELRLSCQPNAGSVDYEMLVNGGSAATGSLSSNLPADSLFMTFVMSTAVGTGAGTTTFNFVQMIANSRY